MGDRANIAIMSDNSAIYFYTHWTGYTLPSVLQAALIRGRDRWSDGPYLARVIFNQMTMGRETDVTGFGIATYICDNDGYPVLVVDAGRQVVLLADADDAPHGNGMEWSFSDFVALEDLPKREWDALKRTA